MILIRVWAVPIAALSFMLSLIANALWNFAEWIDNR